MMGNYDRKVGDVCRDMSCDWYVITRIGPQGGTYGRRFYGNITGDSTYGSLNTTTDVVKPCDMPDKVVAALAVFALTGKGVQAGG